MSEPKLYWPMVCRRATDFPLAAGSIQERCIECNLEVWLSPDGQQQRDQRPDDIRVFCNKCGLAYWEKHKAEFQAIVLNPTAKKSMARES